MHTLLARVIRAVEQFAHADRPGGHDSHTEFALDLVHDVHRVLHLAVHLVDEVRIGVRAPATDLAGGGLRLDAVGRDQ
jgi:hypothetical protein